MTVEEIQQIPEQFAAAALLAKRAGFDGVQIHMAHGYLLSEFVDPTVNRRTDSYGGTAQNRFRLPEAVIQAVRRELWRGLSCLYQNKQQYLLRR